MYMWLQIIFSLWTELGNYGWGLAHPAGLEAVHLVTQDLNQDF